MRGRLRNYLLAIMSLYFFAILPPMADLDTGWVNPAYSDDGGDDDESGGGGGGGGGSSGSGGNGSGAQPASQPDGQSASQRARRAGPRGAPALAAVSLPAFAPAEIVALGLLEEDLASLIQRGYRVIETREMFSIGATLVRLGVPAGVGLEAARAEVRGLRAGIAADFNHFYRPEQAEPTCDGAYCAQFNLIGMDTDNNARIRCGASAEIGMIDTGINVDHETFIDRRLEVMAIASDGLEMSGIQHGTAVAALMIGAPASRSPGLLPSARLVAINAFYKAGRDQRSNVFLLIQAMDKLAKAGLRVINMSLSGPPNDLLQRMVEALSANGVVIVAAAGNGGPQAAPVYPAAYRQAIAVTAIDRNGEVYRRSGRGAYIDFAAPGVNVWTAASKKGARPKSGTSFAAPFVSAAAAVMIARNPRMTPADVVRRLIMEARDLGSQGPDEVFGNGLVQYARLCQAAILK